MKDYKEYYKLPLRLDEQIGWVWDSKDNFVFQFETNDIKTQNKIINVINEQKNNKTKSDEFTYKGSGLIRHKGIPIILMRGWGNLTSPNSFNLSPEEACYVQDTFAQFIVETLNKAIK